MDCTDRTGSIRNLQWQIQRRACRADFLTGNLEVRGNSILDSSDSAADENSLSRENLLTPAERRPLLEVICSSR